MSEPHPIALIIEDEPQIRRFVRAALEAADWQVHKPRRCSRASPTPAPARPMS